MDRLAGWGTSERTFKIPKTPYISSTVWTSLHPSQRTLKTDRWKEWADEGITSLQAVTRYREHGSSVAKV
eukprot:1226336-Amphidinium_carterae.1